MTDAPLVAVTGATGFLGRHLTERLLEAGYRVRILARNPLRSQFAHGRVEGVIVGDIRDRVVVAKLVRGADAVIHLVSNFRTAGGPSGSYRSINVEGTRTVLEVSAYAGVRRFIHCSTIGVFGDVQGAQLEDDGPFNPGDLYQATKLEAERLCLEHAQHSAMEIVVLRPASIYGPGDLRMLKMFRLLARRRFVLLGRCDAHFHAIYIDDLVDGFLQALTAPNVHGEAFILAGRDHRPLREYLAIAARAVGAPAPRLRLPYWFAFALSVVCERICVPLGLEPPLHPRRVRFFRNNRAFSIARARQRLGFAPAIDLEEGFRRTVAWYRANGYLAPTVADPTLADQRDSS